MSGKWKSDIVDELDDLQEYLQREYNWQLDDAVVKRGMLELEDGERVEMDLNGADEDDESGEYAPTVVALTPAQLQDMEGSDAGEKRGAEESEEEADVEDMDMRY
jgi:A1 cistron-splicing factor AAR2